MAGRGNRKKAGSAIRQTRQRKQRRRQSQRQQRLLSIVLLLVGGVVLVGALFIFGNQPATGEIPADALERYEGYRQASSEGGFPMLGDAESSISLKLYTSFDCARCAEQAELLQELLPRFAAGSGVSLQYIPIVPPRMLEFQNAEFATKFALCAGRSGRFWEYQEALFDWQEFEQRAYSSARLRDGIEQLGLARAAVEDCVRGNRVNATINAALEAAEAQLGFNQYGFPLFVVNLEPIAPTEPGTLPALEQVNAALDAALAAALTADEEAAAEGDIGDAESASDEATEAATPTPAFTATVAATEEPALPAPGAPATLTPQPPAATESESETENSE